MTRLTYRSLLLMLSLLPSLLSAQDEDRPLFKSSYRVINVHRHANAPDEQTLKAELEVMDRVGIGAMVILDGRWSDSHLPAWMTLRKKYPDRLIVFGNINWGRRKEKTFFTDIVKELELQHRLGMQGVKIWKDLGMYLKDADDKLLKADDPRLDPYWAKCGELGLPVLMHLADPKEYWYPLTYNSLHYGLKPERDMFHNKPEMPRWEELIRQRDSILKKHPKTRFIGAHMGSQTLDLQALSEALDRYPNFHVECAARLRLLGRLNPVAVRDFFTKYQDRVLFGTDMEILQNAKGNDAETIKRGQDRAGRFCSRYLEYFETDRRDIVEPYAYARDWLRLPGVKLPPDVLKKFYQTNAEKLIPGLSRQPVKP